MRKIAFRAWDKKEIIFQFNKKVKKIICFVFGHRGVQMSGGWWVCKRCGRTRYINI